MEPGAPIAFQQLAVEVSSGKPLYAFVKHGLNQDILLMLLYWMVINVSAMTVFVMYVENIFNASLIMPGFHSLLYEFI